MKTANDVLAALKAELASADFASYDAAVAAINNGSIRARYLSLLDGFWGRGAISERQHADLGRDLNLICDRAIARLAPVQCSATGWTSLPKSSLTEI
jgi:hypothetical protein